MSPLIFVSALCSVLLGSQLAAADPLPEFTMVQAGSGLLLIAGFGGAVMAGCGFDVKLAPPAKTKCEIAAGTTTAILAAIGIPLVIVGRRQTVSSINRLTFTAMTSGAALDWTQRF